MDDLMNIMKTYHVKNVQLIKSNDWYEIEFNNILDEPIKMRLLLLIIPLNTQGTIETVLLGSIANSNDYDNQLVERSREFVKSIDNEHRYLKKRRHRVKAEFNVFFSIRVPEDYYTERQKIFMNFPWTESTYIKQVFQKLNDLA